jgi:type IV pilus assembly protein PilN
MKLNVNLASRRYEDARRFLVQWGSLLALLVIVTVGLVALAVASYMSSRGINQQTAELRARIAELDHEKTKAQAILAQPGNREISDRSRFVNTLFARKAFSWTQVFADLEKIMPPKVHVVAIRPDYTQSHELEIHLFAVGDTREKAVELVRKLEQSSTFRGPLVREEKDQPNGPNSGVEFEIVAQYVPTVAKTEPSASTRKGGQ